MHSVDCEKVLFTHERCAMATKTKLESAHETVNKAQTVLDAADKSLHAAEKAAEKAAA